MVSQGSQVDVGQQEVNCDVPACFFSSRKLLNMRFFFFFTDSRC